MDLHGKVAPSTDEPPKQYVSTARFHHPKKKRHTYRQVNGPNLDYHGLSQIKPNWNSYLTEALIKADDEISAMLCWISDRCFTVSNKNLLRSKMNIMLQAPNDNRRTFFLSLLTTSDVFVFNWNTVCSHFLSIAFRFSGYLQ